MCYFPDDGDCERCTCSPGGCGNPQFVPHSPPAQLPLSGPQRQQPGLGAEYRRSCRPRQSGCTRLAQTGGSMQKIHLRVLRRESRGLVDGSLPGWDELWLAHNRGILKWLRWVNKVKKNDQHCWSFWSGGQTGAVNTSRHSKIIQAEDDTFTNTHTCLINKDMNKL